MYLIVDIRTHHQEDIPTLRYALNWGNTWQKYNPHDTLLYLILEDQIAPEGVRVFRAKKSTLFSPRRRLTLENSNEILRCINFSRYAPYDPSIPTLTHIFDMGQWLYDNTTNAHILRRKEREYAIKKVLHHSSHIIVPDFPTGSELVELWNVREDAIDILPFLDIAPLTYNPNILPQLQIEPPYFIYDGGYGNESNIFSLLEGFAQYIHGKK